MRPNTYFVSQSYSHTILNYSMRQFYLFFLFLTPCLLIAQDEWTILERQASILLRDVHFSDDDNAYAVGGDALGGLPLSVLLRTTDGGASWEEVAVPFTNSLPVYGTHFVTPERGWVVGADGTIFYTEDGGTTWGNQISGTTRRLSRVLFVDDNTGYIVGGDNDDEKYLVLKTTDGGLTWQDLSFGDAAYGLADVFFTDADNGWVGGNSSTGLEPVIYRTTDGGLTWIEQALPDPLATTFATVTGIAFAPDGQTGYACVNSLYLQVPLLKTTDGGETWTEIFTSERDYHHLAVRDADNVALVATSVLDNGDDRLYVSNDGGASFTTFDLPVKAYAGGVSYRNDDIVIVADQSVVARSTSNGTALTVTNAVPRLDDIDWQDELNGWITSGYVRGTQPFSMRTTNGGNTWTEVPGAPGGTAIDFLDADPERGWILFPGQQPQLWRTTDGGDNWLVKQVSNGGGFLDGFFFVDANTGWVFGGSGIIRKTTDGGASFSFQDLATSNLFVQDVHFVDANEGWCAGGFGGAQVFLNYSTDGGDTWTAQTPAYDNQILDLDFVDNQRGWACTVDGLVQRTTDGGQTWTGVGSVPHEFADEIHMFGNGEGYLVARDRQSSSVAGRGHIYSTTDGGDTWTLEFTNEFTQGSLSGFALNPDGNPWTVGNHRTIAYRGMLVSDTDEPRTGGLPIASYPNPFNETVRFRFTPPAPTTATLSIFSAEGRLVHTQRATVNGEQTWTWSPGDLPAGAYGYVLEVNGYPTGGILIKE